MKKLLAIAFMLSFTLNAVPAGNYAPADPVIRVTPAAPKFADSERQAELARRRDAVSRKMAPNSIMVLWSAEPRNYAGDVDFMYRQENNLYYLTSLKQGRSTLVISKVGDDVREYLFLPLRDPGLETWNGKMYSNEDASRISGLRTIIPASEQTAFFTALGKKEAFTSKTGTTIATDAATLYLQLPRAPNDSNGKAEFQRESEFAEKLTGYEIENARDIIEPLRYIKSPYEIRLLQHAIDITTEAQMRSMAMVGRAKMEYEVQAEVEYTFRRRNADYWGYPSIVGCGPNATTLHYVESQGEINRSDVLLMDVGAEYDHYTADVTRTFPVDGKFSKEQADIYRIVYDAQEAVGKATKPGALMNDVEGASVEVIKQGLAKLGLITAPNATVDREFNGRKYTTPQFRIWFMHGTSHWLGMNVHDVGDDSQPLQPGMVFTNEPGIYLRGDALDYLPDTPNNKAFLAKVRPVFERYKNIGVRIEDDMLVTANGVEWMTNALPRKLEDVEAFMKRAQKEFRYTARHNMFPDSILLNATPNLGRDFSSVRRNAASFGGSHDGHSHGE